MIKKSTQRFLAVSASVLMVALVTGQNAHAQRAGGMGGQSEAVEGRQFSSAAGAIANEAQTLLGSGQYNAGINKSSEGLALPNLNAYERTTFYQMQAMGYAQLDDANGAIRALEGAVNAGGMLPKEVSDARLNIAKMMMSAGRYAEGAQGLENYYNNSGVRPQPQDIELIMQGWVEASQYQRALPWAERWFNNANPKERKHFDLLNFMYNNLGMSGKQADIVLQMIQRFPEDSTLWDTWSGMLANGGREADAFEVNKMRYLGGDFNSEQDLVKTVDYHSVYEMPFQAAKILEREMNAGRISRSTDNMIKLSNLLRQAREFKRAIPVLEQAAQNAGTGTVYAQLGEAFYNEKRCGEAQTAFEKAVNLGYRERGKAWFLVASCLYESSQDEERIDCKWPAEQKANAARTKLRNQAVSAFDRVPSGTRESRDASQWKKFIAAEADAQERRCVFELNVERDRCYLDIANAYESIVFTEGNLVLSDEETCTQYVEAYEKVYVIKTEE